MLNCCILGASGYTGLELARLLWLHPEFALEGLYVSENSADAGKTLEEIDGSFCQDYFKNDKHILKPVSAELYKQLSESMDLIFLATPHAFSHDVVPVLLSGKAKVLDLSGSFRLKESSLYAQYYQFEHQHSELLEQAVYGLAEWNPEEISDAKLIAVPGCYPTASLLGLKPLMEENLIDSSALPIINAVSGVSGAGRKATQTNSFCEVSLQAYGVHGHRHQPEISQHLNHEVLFTPHLGNFKRGILATITVKIKENVHSSIIDDAFHNAYANSPLVKMVSAWPKLENVVGTNRCHLHWQFEPNNQYLIVSSAIDNLLKGAASQAIQNANLMSGFETNLGLGE